MPLPWVIVGGTGYDVEEVLDPETRDMRCPSCEKHVRFVERQLVKNLRVFGVPLVGVERGRRVFECPHCKTCVERGDDAPSPGAGGSARRGNATTSSEPREPVGGARAAVAALEQLIARAEDEVWLWKRRAETAERAGESQLAAEALELSAKAERERDRLRAELGRGARARPAVVARPAPGGGAVPVVDDEFAALKARLAQRGTTSDEDEPAATAGSTAVDATPEAAPASRDAERPKDDEAEAPAADVEAEFAALKAKLRPGAGPSGSEAPAVPPARERDKAEYEALKREMEQAPPEPSEHARDLREVPPAAPRGTGAESPPPREPGGPGDPLADLKRKLRKG